MLASRLTSKYQATIPDPVRKALHLSRGDGVIFELKTVKGEPSVVLRKALPTDLEYAKLLSHTLSEWHSENDDEAYRDL